MIKRKFLYVCLLTMASTAPVHAIERSCNAEYQWQSTGGSIGPVPFASFTATGSCGNTSVANRCRKRARAAAVQCMKTQWDRRWPHHPITSTGAPDPNYDRQPPEACSSGAKISGYSLAIRCPTKRKTGQHPNPAVICDFDAHSSNIAESVLLAARGDIKSRLEAEVCLIYKNGAHQFSNNSKVHVKLIARTRNGSNNRHCRHTSVLSTDYKIDCNRVRERVSS